MNYRETYCQSQRHGMITNTSHSQARDWITQSKFGLKHLISTPGVWKNCVAYTEALILEQYNLEVEEMIITHEESRSDDDMNVDENDDTLATPPPDFYVSGAEPGPSWQ